METMGFSTSVADVCWVAVKEAAHGRKVGG